MDRFTRDKRKRTASSTRREYTPQEKQLLRKIKQSYPDSAPWSKIKVEFNDSVSLSRQRTAYALSSKWRGMENYKKDVDFLGELKRTYPQENWPAISAMFNRSVPKHRRTTVEVLEQRWGNAHSDNLADVADTGESERPIDIDARTADSDAYCPENMVEPYSDGISESLPQLTNFHGLIHGSCLFYPGNAHPATMSTPHEWPRWGYT